MKYLAIDPSFRRTGVSILDGHDINIFRVSVKLGKKDFSNLFRWSRYITFEIDRKTVATSGVNRIDNTLIELPFVGGEFSTGLFMLDGLILDRCIAKSDKVYRTDTQYVKKVLGSKNASKSDSVGWAKSVFPVFKDLGYNIKIEGQLSHDEAESFIFLCSLIVKVGEEEHSELIRNLKGQVSDFFLDRIIDISIGEEQDG